LKKEESLALYKRMLILRTFEERVSELFAQGRIPGFLHLYIGEEAVAVGICANLRKDDWITSTHRGHGHCLAKGAEPKYMMAELYGKKTGYCQGKGGSMHISAFDVGILCASGIVGGGLPLATGCGLSAKVRGTDQVAVCFFGDGASNQGTFHESLNLAAVKTLPVIYVCENNLWAQGNPIWESAAEPNLAVRAKAYAIPGITVDGNDVMEVYAAMKEAVERARKGKGPSLIVCNTYRWRGHSEGAFIARAYAELKGERWRSEEEIAEWKAKCPIKRFKTELIEKSILTEKKADTIVQEVKGIIEDAIKFAEESPFPAPEETLDNVYA
jgi:pyruvate dehydrogenase E1 component alpha subunit